MEVLEVAQQRSRIIYPVSRDVLLDQVRFRIAAIKSAEKVFDSRTASAYQCKAKLASTSIANEEGSWIVRLSFEVSARPEEESARIRRLHVPYEALVPIPTEFAGENPDPRVQVGDISCSSSVVQVDDHYCLDVSVRFHLTIEGLSRTAATVITVPDRGACMPGSTPAGASYGDWQARLWRRVLETPAQRNPYTDTTGEFGAADQSGPVWFLYGTPGGQVSRTCAVPGGRLLLIPVITVLAGRLRLEQGTVESLYRWASSRMDFAAGLEVRVDDVPFACVPMYRTLSRPFTGRLPRENVLRIKFPPGVQGLEFEAVADGYLVMLEPLPAGKHIVSFRGGYNSPYARLNAGVTYHLDVQEESEHVALPGAAAQGLPSPSLVAPGEGLVSAETPAPLSGQ